MNFFQLSDEPRSQVPMRMAVSQTIGDPENQKQRSKQAEPQDWSGETLETWL